MLASVRGIRPREEAAFDEKLNLCLTVRKSSLNLKCELSSLPARTYMSPDGNSPADQLFARPDVATEGSDSLNFGLDSSSRGLLCWRGLTSTVPSASRGRLPVAKGRSVMYL